VPEFGEKIFRAAIVLALLTGASGPSYYYLHHLPAREARLDAERAEEAARQEAARQTEALLRERAQFQIHARYQRCLTSAATAYRVEWTANCQSQVERAKRAYPACVAAGRSKAECAGAIEFSPECALANGTAEVVTGRFERQQDRCLRELEQGLSE
jgi:hypothetical protein